MHLTNAEIASRVPVWYALSEIFTGRELQDYDYRWMAQVLKASGKNREEILTILDEEVAPVLQINLLYSPAPVMQGWSEQDVKEMVLEYVIRKPTLIERLVPARVLLKQRRKYIQTEIDRLCAELDSPSEYRPLANATVAVQVTR
ncbi:hypothetical protein SMZ82_004023 [Cronobacter malonaticus]|uniref:DUF7079 family protein n=1 Tax=Cronobacter malonaticus TaxID=413503 RepID=UPI00067C05EC|nr:hypothetical protein [Cronobacter malonaticus]EGT4384303.1 hypothetical protein [Cronobacter malonaticus]EGT4421997.1 hypothetical protein [Cronobacter malonaticus]EGT4447088.1 hypothetical protein [Cronobacter malonaticus]EGT4456343.1 hypothetical protein [Cronobacter malonaticus]EKP4388680.1 hypothetical protein [Cronobacter malonaticus]